MLIVACVLQPLGINSRVERRLAFFNTTSSRMLRQLALEAAQTADKCIFVENRFLLLAGWLVSRNTQPPNLGSLFCNNCQKWKGRVWQ